MSNRKNKKADETLSDSSRLRNRARFLEETSHGVFELMERQGLSRASLARRLGCSRSFVTKLLEGSHNFKLETLADVYLALGRGVHITLSDRLDEMRLPVDEALEGTISKPVLGFIGEELTTFSGSFFDGSTGESTRTLTQGLSLTRSDRKAS